MTGVYILDKSTFQSLSARESSVMSFAFMRNLIPILVYEILGDLAKEHERQSADKEVKELVNKLGGSGPPVSLDFKNIATGNLLGFPVAMTGQIIPDPEYSVETSDGGLIMDSTPLNRAILRWRNEQFEEFERLVAQRWRDMTLGITADHLEDFIRTQAIVVPQVTSIEEALSKAREMLVTGGALRWLAVLYELLTVPAQARESIEYRYATGSVKTLRLFAPYSYHVLLVFLVFIVAHKNEVIKYEGKRVPFQPSNLVDLQYLNYLPFCQIFSSRDRLHLALAPLFLRRDQILIPGDELKETLAETARLVYEAKEMDPDTGTYFTFWELDKKRPDLKLMQLRARTIALAKGNV